MLTMLPLKFFISRNKKMNRNQPAAVIAAQQKLLEAASRQVIKQPTQFSQSSGTSLKMTFSEFAK